jgi:antitoxin component YwqK of YwqJK toxin-antitoxin module
MIIFLIIFLYLTVLSNSCICKSDPIENESNIYDESGFVYPISYKDENFQKLVNDSLKDGKWIGYFFNTKTIAFIGFYKNGKPDGIFQYFYKSGKIRHTCVYNAGKENGPFTFWHKEGTISMIGYYKEDKQHGEWYDWWSNGQLRRHFFYKDGLQEGIDCYYDSLGNLEWKGNYTKGYPIGIWNYYKDKRLERTRIYIDSITSNEIFLSKKYNIKYFPKQEWTTYDSLGHFIEKITFNGDYTLSKKVEYFTDGKIKNVVDYNDGWMHFIGSEKAIKRQK